MEIEIEAYLCCLLLEFLNGTFVNPSTLVNEVTGGGGLAGVHVANDHDVDMQLLLRHGGRLGT